MSDKDLLQEGLSKCIKETIEQYFETGIERDLTRSFSSRFSQHYYHENSYLFLLRYGCGVTSLGYAELCKLLSCYAETIDGLSCCVSIQSSRSLRSELATIWETFVAPLPEFKALSTRISALYKTSYQSSGESETFADEYKNMAQDDKFTGQIESVASVSAKKIASIHGRTLRDLIVLDAYYSTCAVSISNNMRIDLPNIVGRAGYVHSAGPLLYIRSAGKFETKALLTDLRRYRAGLVESGQANGKIPFFLMANEHLDPYDGDRADSGMGGGIYQVRIPKDKYFIGGQPAGDFWDGLASDGGLGEGFFLMPGERDPHREIESFKETNPAPTESLFLARDFGIDERGGRSDRQYVFVYARRFRNSSPFAVFDESKPGWYAPVTAPHTLTNAMFNLCLSPDVVGRLRGQETLTICDPFSGAGTSLIEALKVPGSVAFVAGDLFEPANIARADNIAYFSLPRSSRSERKKYSLSSKVDDIQLSITDLANLVDGLKGEEFKKLISSAIKGAIIVAADDPPQNGTLEEVLRWVLNDVTHLVGAKPPKASQTQACVRGLREKNFSNPLVSFEGKAKLPIRILTYIFWRAILKVGHTLYRGKEDQVDVLYNAILAELAAFKKNCILLADIRRMRPDLEVKKVDEDRRLLSQQGWYCREIVVPRDSVEQPQRFVIKDHGSIDAIELLRMYTQKLDIVITDPPYGFNTDSDEDNLKLYRELPRAIVRSLRHNGQAVICLPEQSHNGQNIPSYARRSWFVRAFAAEAARDDARVIRVEQALPDMKAIFESPYYWRSSRALTRSVLHFTLARNKV